MILGRPGDRLARMPGNPYLLGRVLRRDPGGAGLCMNEIGLPKSDEELLGTQGRES